MSRLKLNRRLAGLVFPVLLAACQSAAPATPSATATVPPSATATALPSATPSLTPTNTATPTASATATSTVTPSSTPTQTPTPDPLAGAVLQLSDLPQDFTELTAADRTRLGFSDEALARAYGKAFATAQLHNAAGFLYSSGGSIQIVLAHQFYPLSPLEQAAMDVSLSDPAVFTKAFLTGIGTVGAADGAKTTAKTLAGMNKFGNKSAGVASVITSPNGIKLHLDIVIVRRGRVFEVYYSVYTDKTKPPAALADMVKAVDARVAAALK